MSTTPFTVESILDEKERVYFRREGAQTCSWMLPFAQGSILMRLVQDGNFLLLRTMHLAKFDAYPQRLQKNLIYQLLRRNYRLAAGNYCVEDDQEIVFEVSLPLFDTELTSAQLDFCFGLVAHEMEWFQKFGRTSRPSRRNRSLFSEALTSEESKEHPRSESSEHQAQEKAPSDESYEVILTNVGDRKLKVLEAVKQLRKSFASEATTWSECLQLINNAPGSIGKCDTRLAAEAAVRKLQAAGAAAVIV